LQVESSQGRWRRWLVGPCATGCNLDLRRLIDPTRFIQQLIISLRDPLSPFSPFADLTHVPPAHHRQNRPIQTLRPPSPSPTTDTHPPLPQGRAWPSAGLPRNNPTARPPRRGGYGTPGQRTARRSRRQRRRRRLRRGQQRRGGGVGSERRRRRQADRRRGAHGAPGVMARGVRERRAGGAVVSVFDIHHRRESVL